MRLTEDLSEVEDRPDLERLVGDIESDEEISRLTVYRRILDAYVLSPARIAARDSRARWGFLILALFAFMATVWADMYDDQFLNENPALVRPFDWEYTQQVYGVEVWAFPLGTNDVGYDILQRIVNASPYMAEFVLAGALVSTIAAVLIGITAGYKGGRVDDLLMGLTDVVLTIPGLPLVILLAAIFEPRDPFVVGMILAIDNWPGTARALRSQVLTIRNESYVESSRTMGMSLGSILFVDIIPQLMPYTLISAASAGKAVITEAVALYFLGFLSPSSPNWGRMLDEAYQYGAVTQLDFFYLALWPMLVLALLSFGLVLTAQGLDHIFNPRLRARHSTYTGATQNEESSEDD